MWQMYSVFEDLFGLQKLSSKPLLKPVVVGDKIQQKLPSDGSTSSNGASKKLDDRMESKDLVATEVTATSTTTTSTTVTSPWSSVTSGANAENSAIINTVVSCSSITTSTVTTVSSSCSITSSLSSSDAPLSKHPLPPSPHEAKSFNKSKVNQRPVSNCETQVLEVKQYSLPPNASHSSSTVPSSALIKCDKVQPVPVTSNPLLDTIGALASSNPDSDDSDLDVVYQQLRYNRGRHRRPEQGRIRTQRSQRHHHHQHFASSDPESTSYAGSNSIDSGYKSQCATPEVSDSLSAPEVRRSASDVSASDSSTTSGQPHSTDGNDPKSSKIKMGTRVIVGRVGSQGPRSSRRHSPLLESSMRDVTLDHLMYLRQSLRKDRQDYLPSSSQGSIPSSSASSTVRDELSPCVMTDEECSWSDKPRLSWQESPVQQYQSPMSYSPVDSAFHNPGQRHNDCARRGRRLSAGNEVSPENRSSRGSPSDFLLSGMEYYDLDSIQDFPQSRGSYVAMVEEKTRCSRIHLISASKREMAERHIDPLYKKKKDQARMQGLDSAAYERMPQTSLREPPQTTYRSHQPHHGSDSKLTEAAIRVLEMIEDFRMEEAIEHAAMFNKDPRGKMRPSISPTSVGPHAFVPRFRKGTGAPRTNTRPASTGPLISNELVQADAKSIASSSSYAASAEHHVYEEIMYDLVCERTPRAEQQMHPMTVNGRNRLLPASPLTSLTARNYPPEMGRVRSHKHKSNMYSMVAEHDPRNVDRFLNMEWHQRLRGHRDNMPPDYPV